MSERMTVHRARTGPVNVERPSLPGLFGRLGLHDDNDQPAAPKNLHRDARPRSTLLAQFAGRLATGGKARAIQPSHHSAILGLTAPATPSKHDTEKRSDEKQGQPRHWPPPR